MKRPLVKLDIGCGEVCEPGWTGVDPNYYGPDIVPAPADVLPYEPGTVDAIRSSHALEHIHKDAQVGVWAEWARVLRPGGTVWVAVPDSLYVLQYRIDHPDDPWATIMIEGQGRWPGDAHLTAFAPDTLRALAERAGFVVDSVTREWTHLQNQQSIVLEAHRP